MYNYLQSHVVKIAVGKGLLYLQMQNHLVVRFQNT